MAALGLLEWSWRGRGSPALSPHPCPQVDAQLLTVQKLEEKERALQGSLGGVEKELTLRSQALELNKRKVRPDLCEGTATWDAGSQPHFVTLPRELEADDLGRSLALLHLTAQLRSQTLTVFQTVCWRTLHAWSHFSLKIILQQFLLLPFISEKIEAQGGS